MAETVQPATSLADYLKRKNGGESLNQAHTSLSNAQANTQQIVNQPLNFADVKVNPVNTKGMSKIDEQTALANNSQQAYGDFLKGSSQAYYDEQKAMADANHAQRIAELQSAYDQAVRDGELSQEEAEKQLTREIENINKEAYTASQATELSAQRRGIGNSQQLLAMQQGDKRFSQDLRSDARVARDDRISAIRNRIDAITNQHNLDVSVANTNYNSTLAQARAQAMNQYNQGMGEMTLAQYKSALEMKNNLTLQEQEQLNQLQRMETQQGYDLTKMQVQNDYTLGQMAQQQEYTQDNMNLQYKLDLGKMKTQHGYDMQKIDTQFKNDLTKMAKQHGYDMSKLSQQQRNAMSQIDAQRRASIASANAKANAELASLERAYLDKNSTEYKVRKAQIEESHTNATQQAYHTALGKAQGQIAAESYVNNMNNVGTLTAGGGKSSGGNIFTNFVDWVKGK